MTKELLLNESDLKRFWDKVDKESGDIHPVLETRCWLWTAGLSEKGYGTFRFNGRMQKAHRLTYELRYGEIPKGLEPDHLCSNRRCIRPEHLEAVTHRENIHRSNGIAAKNAKKTHCLNDHEFDNDNTYFNKTSGSRQCRQCRKDRTAAIDAGLPLQRRAEAFQTPSSYV